MSARSFVRVTVGMGLLGTVFVVGAPMAAEKPAVSETFTIAQAPYLPPKDTRTEEQKRVEENLRRAKETEDKMKADQTKQDMRDTTHEGRLKLTPDMSVGGKIDPPQVDIRKSTNP
jgi:hypothetical protein